MKVIGVIPARFGSVRFKGKPLKNISGKPLLQWVIEGALQAKSLAQVIVATDDQRIADIAKKSGVQSVMTHADLPSGSDRVWAAVKDIKCDGILNIQGDEPLITGPILDTLVSALNGKVEMATLARPIKSVQELENPNVAKVVVNSQSEAVYFSRLPIPHSRPLDRTRPFSCLKHIGLYGYNREFLKRFCEVKPTDLELAEGLEQLRALWMGARIKVVLTDYESWGVDTPEDVIRVEEIINTRRK